jgi:phthalate 4,5-cis-dihydrodiol dehydrogenase
VIIVNDRVLRIGAVGLGRGFSVMLPTFVADPRVQLVAAADPRAEARRQFAADFGGDTYASVEELCADPDVEVVYVASPHQFHAEHVGLAAAARKHVLVEKPMAITLDECERMTAAARSAGIHLVVGHSHSFDLPVRRTREIIASGAVGAPRMITALNFTDFLYRPRRPEELVTAQGGGVVFSQAAHQVDIVRLLGGGRVRSVRASTGAWDPARPTEGAYSALLTFDDGLFASVTYNGYGHFDSDEFCGWIDEMGAAKDQSRYGAARRALRSAAGGEAALKNARAYGGPDYKATPPAADARQHQHFGMLLVSCERADLRPLPFGVVVYGETESRLEPLAAPAVPRGEVIDELYDAVVHGRPPLHSGEWSTATLEVCLALLTSSREQREVELRHQVPVPAA